MNDQKNKDSNLSGMNDEEMVEVHAKLNKEKHPPTEGFLIAPLIFVFVFGCYLKKVKKKRRNKKKEKKNKQKHRT